MMEVSGLRQAEQGLQQPLGWRGWPQVLAADHQGHARRGVVDNACKMVGGGGILTGQDGIAEIVILAVEPLAILLGPSRKAGDGQGLGGIQPPAMRGCSTPPGIVRQGPAGTGIEAARVAVRRG